MRKLCPNLDREDGLDTVLEVPIPEEMFASSTINSKSNNKSRYNSMISWMRSHVDRSSSSPSVLGRANELQLLLGVIGAPLVPLPIQTRSPIINHGVFKDDDPIEASMAKYILQQYTAAAGGERALDSISSMYAMGKVQMATLELRTGGTNATSSGGSGNKKHPKGSSGMCGEMGAFVLWQRKPELWCLELVVSGTKISAGSDGRVAWRQTPWHPSHASRGPPRPLRRFLQGLDPRSTANLFTNSAYIGEKAINGEDCFILRLDAEASALRARSSNSVEIIRHTIWGYFSQRTGLLVQLEDSHLIRIRGSGPDSVYWETTMESLIEDYRPVDGISIAHAGRTTVSLFRFGETADGHTRTRMEETWAIEEVDFNIQGLSMDCFLPPGDLREEKEGCDVLVKNAYPAAIRSQGLGTKIGSSKVAAVDIDDDGEDDSDHSMD